MGMASSTFNAKLAAALSSVLVMMSGVSALQYEVGGPTGWVVGEDFQKWASEYTFYAGDELYFHYKRKQSSVLLVTEQDYQDCSADKEVASDDGQGDMVLTLLTAESYFFISGHADQCKAGLRVEIPVLEAQRQQGSPASSDIPSSPVILSPPGSINTPYSTVRPNNASSLSSLGITSMLFYLVLALASTYILIL